MTLHYKETVQEGNAYGVAALKSTYIHTITQASVLHSSMRVCENQACKQDKHVHKQKASEHGNQ